MQYSNYRDAIIVYYIKYTVRKPTNESSVNIPVDSLVLIRVFSNTGERFFDTKNEVVAEIYSAGFIVLEGLRDICFGFLPN